MRFFGDFEVRRPDLEELRRRIQDLISQLLADGGLRVHALEARVKDGPSLERKWRHHNPPYTSLDDLTDLLGVRIITFFPDDVDHVRELIESQFTIDRLNSRDPRATIEPDQFGYQSLHLVVSISPARAGLSEWRRFAAIRFEIQVRSILQHAWAEIEHDRGYRSEDDVPANMRRRWSRVAALLEFADSEFMRLRDDAAQPDVAWDESQVAGPARVIFRAVAASRRR